MEKTIKYLENGEYHYATVRAVGDLAKLKTDSKEDLVSAINDLFENSTDPDKAPKPEGYDELVKEVADVIKGQQDLNQQWDKWQEDDVKLTEERKQEYLQNIKSLQDSIDKAKEDASALTDKTNALSDQLTQTFSELDTSIRNMHDQLQKETESISNDLNKTKGDLAKVRTDLQNTQLDNGKIHDSISNINGKFEHKVWEDDLAPMKDQINRNETEVQQTKDQLLEKASQKSVDTLTNAVSNLDTQVKKTAQGLEVTVKKDELGGEIADALNNKTNLLLGTRRFTTNNWQGREHVDILPDTWRGMKVAKQNQPNEGIQQSYQVKADKTYTFSLFAKVDEVEANVRPRLTLAQNDLDTSLESKVDVYQKDISAITTDFKRYSITFTPNVDCLIWPHMVSNSNANKPIYVSGYQLEVGKEPTPWEPSQEDVGDYVEKAEAQFNVYNDKIQALTEKQRQQGDTQEQLRTEVTQTAEGVKQVSESLKNTNGDITKLRGDLERTADHMKSEYESYTNKAVGQISDSTLNLIRNSSFQNKDEDFAQWHNISAKANIRQDENGLRWVELTQSGLTTNNPEGITSNYFNIKQGKVTVAVDIKSGDKSSLDNDSVLSLELYNDAKKRVDFYDVSLSQLGLSKELLGDHTVHRGLYRLGIDRNDAKYMTVKAKLVKNGDLYFTNFSARLSSIDDGGYTPNPDDINQQILKQNTKIEQDAKQIALKANSVDVTRDIKSAVDGIQVGGRNLLLGTSTTEKSGKSYDFAQCSIAGGLQPGTTYTLSGWARVDQKAMDNKQNVFVCAYTSDWSWSGWLNIAGSLTAKYNKITFTTPTGKSFSPVVTIYLSHPNNDNSKDSLSGIGFISRLKLEEGNKATSWTPSPEDVSEEIKSAKDAAIKVASDQIDIHVNEISTSFDDKLNKKVNDAKTASEKFTSDGIEQTVKKITDVKSDVDGVKSKVDNLKVGGRNLVRNTDTDIVIDDTGNTGTQGWRFATINLTQQPKVGDQITVSAEATLTGQGDLSTYDVILYNQAVGTARSNSKRLSSGKRASATLQVNNLDGNGDTVLLIYAGNISDTEGKKNVVHHLKVEFGNVATDWTPAPEDVDSKFQYKEVTGAIDFNNLKTQQKIFYKDVHANNAPAGSNYWYFVDVDAKPDGARIIQTATSDRDNITWKRTCTDNSWTTWQKQATQGDIDTASDGLRQEIKSAKDAAIQVASDQINIHVNELSTSFDDKLNKRVNEVKTASEKFTSDGIEQTVKKITDVQNNVDNLNKKVDSNNGGGINLQKGTKDFSFQIGTNGNPSSIETYNSDTKMLHIQNGGFYTSYSDSSFVPTPGEFYTFSADVKGDGVINGSGFRYEGGNNGTMGNITLSDTWQRIINTVHVDKVQGQWVIYPSNSKNLYVKHIKIERGTVATPWTAAPEDVESTHTLDTANIDEMKTQGHYFVKNLTGNPIGGWVYVDVTGNNNDRIRQDVYQDNGGKHMSRRLFGNSWSGWEQGAYLSDVNNTKTEVTASVKNLGDRVTTEVNSVTSKINNVDNNVQNQFANAVELIQKSDFSDGSKGNWTVQSIISATNPAPPAELGIPGMKVIQSNIRDSYEDVWHSVTPGEKFNVDFWCAPSSMYDSSFGLVFYDANKKLVPSNQWLGVHTDHSAQWKHYTGEITAPGNSAFAKPWFQIDMPADQHNTSWLAKPHIRRQDPRVTEAISEVNTKWDVANGQIQGKVTATDVNNILNGKGYATQSWAQSQFRMKSDSIDLEVRKITDPINAKIDNLQVGGRNLIYGTTDFDLGYSGTSTDSITIRQVLIDNELAQKASTMTYSATIRPADMEGPVQLAIYKTKGDSAHTRVSNTPIAISSTVNYGDSKRLSLTFDLDQDMKEIEIVALETGPNTFKMVFIKEEKLEIGSVPTDWSPAPEEYAKTSNIISSINMSPEQIKLSSNKIVLDGDTEIKGTAFIPSAAIKNITADKITAGTLDVGKLDIKNLKADDIKTGTLSGITVRAGDEDSFFQTSKDNIYWITKSSGSALIGRGKYVRYPGLNIFDKSAVYLGSWAGAVLNQDGTINDRGGAFGNPKFAIETAGMQRNFNLFSQGGELVADPLDHHRIISWVGPKEFLSVEQGHGTHIELNPDINYSQFTVQKDNRFGAYFGWGRDANEIVFNTVGGMTVNGNFRVTGAKNAIVKTSQGTVAINAYETADYYFGDIGSAKTGDSKVAMIDIESLFKETVNTDVEYQVFLTSYGPGDIWVSERQRDYFVVESELPNMEFGWEIKAKRKGYENTRLAKVDVSNVPTV